MNLPLCVSPSILSADFGNLNKDIATIESHSDRLHVDIMDGDFVPNISIGPVVVKDIKTTLPLDCHLMISKPEKYFEEFIKAGASSITFHIETVNNPKELISKIKEMGCQAGVSIKPKTSVDEIRNLINEVDLVLVMTVEPGFGGQKFMEDMLPKIHELRSLRSDLSLHIDGGINAETGKKCIEAGADTLIAGSYIFNAEDRVKAIESLRL